jgi:DNA-directed RNA polymerase subunit RPC12/RpoP
MKTNNCTRCGNRVIAITYNSQDFNGLHFSYKCYDCNKDTRWCPSEKEALEEWNKFNKNKKHIRKEKLKAIIHEI